MVINHNPNIRDPSIKTKECAAGLMFTEKVAGGLVDYPKIIVARRQPPNLLRSLSLSVTRDQNQNSQLPKDSTFSKCTDPRCQFCQLVITSSTYTTKNGTLLKRNQPMCCKTMDLIYVLICQKCKGEYVGETGVTINERTNLHRSQIIHEKYRKLKVSQHIFHCRKPTSRWSLKLKIFLLSIWLTSRRCAKFQIPISNLTWFFKHLNMAFLGYFT